MAGINESFTPEMLEHLRNQQNRRAMVMDPDVSIEMTLKIMNLAKDNPAEYDELKRAAFCKLYGGTSPVRPVGKGKPSGDLLKLYGKVREEMQGKEPPGEFLQLHATAMMKNGISDQVPELVTATEVTCHPTRKLDNLHRINNQFRSVGDRDDKPIINDHQYTVPIKDGVKVTNPHGNDLPPLSEDMIAISPMFTDDMIPPYNQYEDRLRRERSEVTIVTQPPTDEELKAILADKEKHLFDFQKKIVDAAENAKGVAFHPDTGKAIDQMEFDGGFNVPLTEEQLAEYERLEKKHLGDPDKKTGIYDPSVQEAKNKTYTEFYGADVNQRATPDISFDRIEIHEQPVDQPLIIEKKEDELIR